jgi:hypothetical protein
MCHAASEVSFVLRGDGTLQVARPSEGGAATSSVFGGADRGSDSQSAGGCASPVCRQAAGWWSSLTIQLWLVGVGEGVSVGPSTR